MFRDFRFGLKLLWKDRGYAATAILTVAVCIAANTAIFTIVNSVLLKPLPVPESDRILLMSNQYPNALGGATFNNSGVPDYYDRLRDVKVYEEQAMYNRVNLTFDIDGNPQVVQGMAATPSLFRLLRVPPGQGRIFEESEGQTGNTQKLILSYGLWQQLYGGNPAAVGQDIRVAGRPFTVVGVMPNGFEFADPQARFWIPLAFSLQQKSDDARHSNNWYNVGRLKPGATIEQAQDQVNALNAANLERFPQYKQLLINSGFHTRVERLQDMLVRDIERTLYLLWGGAAFVLLIGVVNIGNLVLARSNLRLKELTTRLALGAGHAQLIRQLIIEGLLLCFAGGVGGLLAGFGILRALRTIGLDRLPRASEIQMDITVIVVAMAVSAVIGVLMGLVPAAHVFKVNVSTVLHQESRTGSGSRKARAIRRTLVVAQVAFALVLLIGSGLLLASFRNLLTVDPGFNADHVITAGIGMPVIRYAAENDVRAFTNRVLQTVRGVPGVIHAGGTTFIPLGGDRSDSVILAEGYQMKPGESVISPLQATITPGYLEAMTTRLIYGRYFNDQDTETAPGVVIVDEVLAQKFWPGINPIGKRMYRPSNPRDLLAVDQNTRWLTVVGVVRQVQLEDLAGKPNAGAYYFPAAQTVPRGLVVAIKTAADPAAVIQVVRAELRKIDPAMPLSNVRTMTELTDRSLMPRRAAMLLAISFGAISLFLSAVGIYGVLAYLVTQRTREIGIRIALGSTRRGIFTLILHEGLWLVAGGLLLGLGGTVALRRALQSQIYGLTVMNPLVIGIVVTILGVIALAACSLPARRATRVDPVVVLNQP